MEGEEDEEEEGCKGVLKGRGQTFFNSMIAMSLYTRC